MSFSHGLSDKHYRKVKALFRKEKIEVLNPTELLNRLNPKVTAQVGAGLVGRVNQFS